MAGILTAPVTQTLPPDWQGEYTPHRARQWAVDRDAESTVLIAMSVETMSPAGLLICTESQADTSTEIRLGYLLAEAFWGRGLASELVSGFVTWCRESSDITSIVAGVAADNAPSRRVLEKAGFVPDHAASGEDGDLFYRLRFTC